MEELNRIKALEADLAAGVEGAKAQGQRLVEEARARREQTIGKARSEAEWEAGRVASAKEASALGRAREILAAADDSVRRLSDSYSRNKGAAVELILRELGV